MKVAVFEPGITTPPFIIHIGEWNGKRVDGDFARVEGLEHPVHVGYCFKAEHADMVLNELKNRYEAKRLAQDAYERTWYDLRNQFGAR